LKQLSFQFRFPKQDICKEKHNIFSQWNKGGGGSSYEGVRVSGLALTYFKGRRPLESTKLEISEFIFNQNRTEGHIVFTAIFFTNACLHGLDFKISSTSLSCPCLK